MNDINYIQTEKLLPNPYQPRHNGLVGSEMCIRDSTSLRVKKCFRWQTQ